MGGILGTFHAYFALKQGLKVALLEQHPEPRSATVRNFGQIVPSGMDEKWQRIGRESLKIYQEIQQQVDISVVPYGSIYIASDEEEVQLLRELQQINQQNDYPSDWYAAEKCLTTYPGLKASYCKAGLFFPEEISLDPRLAVSRILRFLVAQYQLDYFPNTKAIELNDSAKGVIAKTANGAEFLAEKVIVCNGSEFRTLYPEVFEQSDLVISKLQMLQTIPQPHQRIPGSVLTGLSIRRYESFAACPSYPEIKRRENADSPFRKWGIHILFKQAADGSVIIGDSHEYLEVASGELFSFDISEAINECILSEAKRIFELEDFQIARSWYGIYSQCKDRDIFTHDISENIHIVTGIGGKGMTGGPGFAASHIIKLFNF